jgi:hypothetical protein
LHDSRPPDVRALLELLARHGVKFVLVGSGAAAAWGVELEPADLDVVPDLEPANLRRLIALLREIEARPPGPFGAWTTLPNGEKKWIARETTREELAAWEPDPANLVTLDNLYHSRLGNFDVVPEITGTYDEIRPRTERLRWHGHEVDVAPIEDLLARLTVPRREKDVPRVARLREIQRGRTGYGRGRPAP